MPAFECYESVAAPLSCRAFRNSEGTIVEVSGGRLLLVYDEFYGPPYRWDIDHDFWESRVVGRFSEDLGRTWGEAFVIQPNDAGINILSPCLLRLQSGELALFYRKTESVNPTIMVGYMRRSFDEGRTWSAEVCLPDRLPGGMERYLAQRLFGPDGQDSVLQLSTGRILVTGGRSLEARLDATGVSWVTRVNALCLYSDDNGETWQRGEGEISAPQRGAMEPYIVELGDGRLLAVMRTQMGHVYKAYSDDRGEHWTESEPIREFVAPESCPNLKRIPTTGDLMLVFNRSYTPGADHGGPRNPLSAALSSDEGRTWRFARDIIVREKGVWQDQKGNKHEWSWSLSNPSLTFAQGKAIVSCYEGVARRGTACSPSSLLVKVFDIDWLY